MGGKTVLTVGGDERVRASIARQLENRGYEFRFAEDAEAGLASHRENGADLVMLLLPLSDGTGRDILRRLRAQDPRVVAMVTGTDATIRGAPEALELGAFEYLSDPLRDTDQLLSLIGISLHARRSDVQLRYLRSKHAAGAGLHTIIGDCPAMRNLFATVRQVCHRTFRGGAPTILVTGETGTGKGLIAKAIHYNSVRRSHGFVDVNCAAVPDALIESELFGHVRGAFTDAHSDRAGLFETADGGTLFLDEIASLRPALQGKLLTVIDDRVVRRIGSNEAIGVDVQLVAATHHDVEAFVRDGKFREDLYHRLNIIRIEVPALRERGNDRRLLAETFIKEMCAEYAIPLRTLSADARAAIDAYDWPGNVRELRNQMERVLLLENEETITAAHLGLDARSGAPVRVASGGGGLSVELPSDPFSLDALEAEILKSALTMHNHNISATARYLGLSRHTLSYRIKKHGL